MIAQLNAQTEVFSQQLKTQSNLEWRSFVMAYNKNMQETILPKVQDAFIRHYKASVANRNGNVKNIEDELVLPSLYCDGDPSNNLMEIREGSVK